jgi:hypothetical protein
VWERLKMVVLLSSGWMKAGMTATNLVFLAKCFQPMVMLLEPSFRSTASPSEARKAQT